MLLSLRAFSREYPTCQPPQHCLQLFDVLIMNFVINGQNLHNNNPLMYGKQPCNIAT